MSDRSGIEWTDATWNVVIGCAKVSPGCDHCYAIRTAHRMQAHPNPKVWKPYAGTEYWGDWTGRVNLVHERLDLPLRWRKPRRIFVNAQSDLFHDAVPDEFIAQVFAVMALAPQHTFQILTKRHARMRSLLNSDDFIEAFGEALYTVEDPTGREVAEPVGNWPLPNVWLGVSAEDQKWFDIRWPALRDTPAAVRMVSLEPPLAPIELPATALGSDPHTDQPGLDWVIVGGESGSRARPMHPDWARALRDQCNAAGIPFLFKQWGEWTPGTIITEGNWVGGAAVTDTGHGTLAVGHPRAHDFGDGIGAYRAGAKATGRELDGRTWDQYPPSEESMSHA